MSRAPKRRRADRTGPHCGCCRARHWNWFPLPRPTSMPTFRKAPEGRRLVLAERADTGWRATLDGKALEPATDGWAQAFDLPTEGGELHGQLLQSVGTMDRNRADHRVWPDSTAGRSHPVPFRRHPAARTAGAGTHTRCPRPADRRTLRPAYGETTRPRAPATEPALARDSRSGRARGTSRPGKRRARASRPQKPLRCSRTGKKNSSEGVH